VSELAIELARSISWSLIGTKLNEIYWLALMQNSRDLNKPNEGLPAAKASKRRWATVCLYCEAGQATTTLAWCALLLSISQLISWYLNLQI
jgi:hypothetical protein